MGDLGQTFSLDQLPTGEEFTPVPDGDYLCTVKGAEVKPTKNGTGKLLKLQLEITGPTHAGRVIFDQINIQNANQVAQEIGLRQFGELMRATGVANVEDSQVFVGRSLSARVTTEHSEGYDPQNRVKRYKPAPGGAPQVTRPATPAAQPSASKPPWVQ